MRQDSHQFRDRQSITKCTKRKIIIGKILWMLTTIAIMLPAEITSPPADKLMGIRTDKFMDIRTDKFMDTRTDKLMDTRTNKLVDIRTNKLMDIRTDRLMGRGTTKLVDMCTSRRMGILMYRLAEILVMVMLPTEALATILASTLMATRIHNL
jgi:hypothetical protein